MAPSKRKAASPPARPVDHFSLYDEHRNQAITSLMCQTLRLRNEHVLDFNTVCRTLLAVKYRVSRAFWELESRERRLYSYKWGMDFTLELGRLLQVVPQWASKKIIVTGGDNKAFYIKTRQQSTEPARRNEMYHTNNSQLISLLADEVEKLIGADATLKEDVRLDNLLEVKEYITNQPENVSQFAWLHFLDIATREDRDSCNILARPDYSPVRPTRLILLEPVGDASTGKNIDIELLLARIFAHIDGIQLVVVFGDQQTWSRLIRLKLDDPNRYKRMIPIGGDFHFLVHAMMALHFLIFDRFTRPFLETCGFCMDTLVQDCSDVK
mmetsp:Transcript_23277/g.72903  ORF Transcript_23277/g.72903 Transcript_23277/m.72903 type:complete len:325 (-) Transcript_23277:908-1882(-)